MTRACGYLAGVCLVWMSACGGATDAGSTGPATTPNAAVVTAVSVSPGSATLTVGATVVLNATVAAGQGYTGSYAVTWHSGDATKASLVANGASATVTALALGTVTITATSTANPGVSGTSALTVAGAQAVTSWTPMTVPFLAGPIGAGAGIWGTSPTNVYTVTSQGRIAHYDGAKWAEQVRDSNALTAIHGSSANDIWAVGLGYLIWHYDGAAWTSTRTPGPFLAAPPLVGVYSFGPGAAMAVGPNGTVMQYNGGSWTQMANVPSTALLLGVWGTSLSDAYVVGAGGAILHYNGSAWSTMSSPLTSADTLMSIWGSSDSNILAVGTNGKVLHYDGASWSQMAQTATTATLVFVTGTSASQAYAIDANGRLLQLNGAWSQLAWSYNTQCGGIVGFASGAVFGTCVDGLTWVYNGGTTRMLSLTPQYNAVHMASDGTGYAGGDLRSIVRYDGSTWKPVGIGDGGYYTGVWTDGATDAFFVWSKGVDRYDGTAVTAQTLPVSGQVLYKAWGTSGSNVFVVGDAGTILHFDGSSWTQMASGTTQTLYGIGGSSATNVLAVGDNGTILHYDGTSWSPMASGTTATITDVSVPDATHAFAAAIQTILSLNGGTWSGVTAIWPANHVWANTATDVYEPTLFVLHFNGVAWSSMDPHTHEALQAMSGTSRGAFAVGSDGTIDVGTSASSSARLAAARRGQTPGLAGGRAGTLTWTRVTAPTVGAPLAAAAPKRNWRFER